jgi:NADP-dependent 3-hydroxy acid dehydrogenase YdfG
MQVVLAARRLDKSRRLRVKSVPWVSVTGGVDVSQPAQIEAMVSSTLDAFGCIDILFNNAGFGRLDWFEALDPVKDIQGQITVDLLGVIWTARAVLPQMYKQRSGHIINMCSIGGWAAPPLYTVYSAAKFGVRGFSEALRRETTPFGVHVSAVYPGSAATNSKAHWENRAKHFVTPDWLVLPTMSRGVVRLAKRRGAVSFAEDHGLSVFFNSHFREFHIAPRQGLRSVSRRRISRSRSKSDHHLLK